ncbi:hypothetical protein XENOCAPTIV_024677 [Xenoophorus captivus]|uniref:Uncharacterized protein n=1 Tax=Xenoophorus captivus TaxID=1517983 RepID=A0ABV0RDD1_9TELE
MEVTFNDEQDGGAVCRDASLFGLFKFRTLTQLGHFLSYSPSPDIQNPVQCQVYSLTCFCLIQSDITSRTQTANSSTESPVPQDESRLTYLDISMSSKPGLIPPVSSQEENKENLSSASDPQPPPSPLQSDDPDLLSRKTLKPQEQGSR